MLTIAVTSVFVDDQEKVLAFYTDVLGFVKKRDLPLGAARWTPMPSLRSPARRRNQRPSPSSSASTPASVTNAATAATAAARTSSGSGRLFTRA